MKEILTEYINKKIAISYNYDEIPKKCTLIEIEDEYFGIDDESNDRILYHPYSLIWGIEKSYNGELYIFINDILSIDTLNDCITDSIENYFSEKNQINL